MRIRLTGIPPACAAVLFALVAAADAQIDRQALRERACAEADERYRQLFGKPASEETMPIILMYKYHFCPGELAVKPGTTVRWINVDRRTSHSVWFRDGGRPETVRLFPEEHVDIVADMEPGMHAYLCGPHWEREGMTGAIEIRP